MLKTVFAAAAVASLVLASPLPAFAAKRHGSHHHMRQMMVMVNGRMAPLYVMMNGHMMPVMVETRDSANGG
jgi:hypothetical protein